jgi:hypothetical protein
VIELPLTKGYVAIIDDEDARLAVHKWQAHERRRPDGTIRAVYATREVRRPGRRPTTEKLHQAVLRAPPGVVEIDHINHDGLDCRRSNLRPATTQQNQANRGPQRNNTSGFKGVRWSSQGRTWQAQIKVSGRVRYLGRFADPKTAASAYDRAALDAFGEFAWLNFAPPALSRATTATTPTKENANG